MRTLMIGGALDGQVMEVQGRPYTLIGAVPPRIYLHRVRARLLAAPEVQHYHRSELLVFGLTIPVYVLAGHPEERVEATLATHLLSPLAHELAKET